MTDNEISLVNQSLNHTDYKYRTVSGIAEESEIPYRTVENILGSGKLDVVRLKRRNINQQELYCLRERYFREASFKERFMSYLLGRIY